MAKPKDASKPDNDIEVPMETINKLTRIATAVDQAAEIVVITDIDANIEFVNPAFERITGYTSAEVIGQNPKILQSG